MRPRPGRPGAVPRCRPAALQSRGSRWARRDGAERVSALGQPEGPRGPALAWRAAPQAGPRSSRSPWSALRQHLKRPEAASPGAAAPGAAMRASNRSGRRQALRWQRACRAATRQRAGDARGRAGCPRARTRDRCAAGTQGTWAAAGAGREALPQRGLAPSGSEPPPPLPRCTCRGGPRGRVRAPRPHPSQPGPRAPGLRPRGRVRAPLAGRPASARGAGRRGAERRAGRGAAGARRRHAAARTAGGGLTRPQRGPRAQPAVQTAAGGRGAAPWAERGPGAQAAGRRRRCCFWGPRWCSPRELRRVGTDRLAAAGVPRASVPAASAGCGRGRGGDAPEGAGLGRPLWGAPGPRGCGSRCRLGEGPRGGAWSCWGSGGGACRRRG